MLISRWIDSYTRQQRMVEDLTKKIAARCETAVWGRIHHQASKMDPAQAAGYIRARAALVIHQEVQLAMQRIAESTDSMVARVTESTTNVIVRRMMAAIATQLPAELRRAA